MVKEVTLESFKSDVLESSDSLIIDFYADWCGPCKTASPIFEELSDEFPQVKFVKVNVDDVVTATLAFPIRSIPTFIFLKNGQVKSTTIGLRSRTDYKKWIESCLA